jgi:enoyl-CoA hydratase
MTELLIHVKGGYGWMTLNRPKALNALSLSMIQGIAYHLKEWEKDVSIRGVIIEGAGGKAFCAGGDVRAVYEAKHKGNLGLCDAFFREEYTLNAHIHDYSKPYISLIDGIAMGGGLGVSVNGSHRIVTEKALLAMPETGIGFFPDVGATHFLNALPDSIGMYLGLTGTRLQTGDALWLGLATHFIPSSSLGSFKEDLERGCDLKEALTTHTQPFDSKGFLYHHQPDIHNHFNKNSLQDILENLKGDSSSFAQNTYNTLRAKSPTSLTVVFRQLKLGKALSFHDQMKLEFRLCQHLILGHDFSEGIRAVLIDKDHLPRWNPAELDDLNLDPYFEPLGDKELIL